MPLTEEKLYKFPVCVRRFKKFLALAAGLLVGANACWASAEPAGFPSLISALKVPGPLEFCGERVPLKSQEIRERLEKELLLTLWDRPQVILWLKRSKRYLPHIRKMMKTNGMPDDLMYVAIAESALRPHAGSSKGAIGFWQFMRHTGRKFGLVINNRIDERRNLFASTRAAIRYLKELYGALGSWTLSVAAYNMGEEGLIAEIMEQETSDYYRLYLPLETQRFVFRIVSVKIILSDPEKYGFKLSKQDYYPPLTFDRIQIKCSGDIPIRIIARAAKTHFKVIKDLNPEIRGHYIAEGNHAILIPKGSSTDFHKRYNRLVREFLAARSERVYVVKKGDSLFAIAEKFAVPLKSILIWNRLDPGQPIHPGTRLIILQENVKSD